MLQLDSAQIRALGNEVLEAAVRYIESVPGRSIAPETSSAILRSFFQEPLPAAATAFEELLAKFEREIAPNVRHNSHPRFFGYVASPGAVLAAFGEFLAAVLNSNVTAYRSSPAGVELEHVVTGWFKTIAGFSEESLGVLTSGGSAANFNAMCVVKQTKGAGRVYITSQTHFSIAKAARLLGLDVAYVPVDSNLRMDVEALERMLAADSHAVAVVGSAGTASTGAVDPLEAIADVALLNNLWIHVDGAYGALAKLAPSVAVELSGMERADSLSLDPHKWLYASVGCGCILYRDPLAARSTFAAQADYVNVVGLERDEAFAFWDYGIDLSRPFRALPLWFLIKGAGMDEIAAAIEANCDCARYFASLIEASDDFELLAPVGLSIVCFRYRPSGFTGDLNKLNEALLVRLQKAGSSYVSNALPKGNFALRACVLNYRTRREDMENLLEDIRAVAAELDAQ